MYRTPLTSMLANGGAFNSILLLSSCVISKNVRTTPTSVFRVRVLGVLEPDAFASSTSTRLPATACWVAIAIAAMMVAVSILLFIQDIYAKAASSIHGFPTFFQESLKLAVLEGRIKEI